MVKKNQVPEVYMLCFVPDNNEYYAPEDWHVIQFLKLIFPTGNYKTEGTFLMKPQ
ncbi:hypothetical protein RM553_17395 [Zunongwangia sp. F363]|uniref:Uncharacterized protein n=1 Tax=Autumnicola tepida TaxID=3075595 RepID=A0ABU3CE38_9FLAO|nr:hypothetical protein [Zunongwangia sp. F363]MDT0644618.1 hypothetical protein [Zunongwangia sp. F363]